jgi:hypothetical protein
MQSEHVEKVYVGPNNTAVLKCPHCGNTKTLKVGRFKGRKDPLRMRCKCKAASHVRLEFRKAFRKKTSLEGIYTMVSGGTGRGRVVVQNLSRKGIGFTTLAKHNLRNGDQVEVAFTLDNEKRSRIEKRAVIRTVNGSYVGCELTEKGRQDAVLGFYLMP